MRCVFGECSLSCWNQDVFQEGKKCKECGYVLLKDDYTDQDLLDWIQNSGRAKDWFNGLPQYIKHTIDEI